MQQFAVQVGSEMTTPTLKLQLPEQNLGRDGLRWLKLGIERGFWNYRNWVQDSLLRELTEQSPHQRRWMNAPLDADCQLQTANSRNAFLTQRQRAHAAH